MLSLRRTLVRFVH